MWVVWNDDNEFVRRKTKRECLEVVKNIKLVEVVKCRKVVDIGYEVIGLDLYISKLDYFLENFPWIKSRDV